MSNLYAEKVVALALEEVGYCEKRTNAQLTSKTANAGNGNWTKYADTIDKRYPNFYNGNKNGYAWCDVFVDCMFITAYGEQDALYLLCQPAKSNGASCTASANYYKAAKRWTSIPTVGAQVFFNVNGSIGHTGLVVEVTTSSVTVVEGNKGDKVQKLTYARTSPLIAGYGLPRFDAKPATVGPANDLETAARAVIAGKYGNGAARKAALEKAGYNYDEVQAIVNKLLK